MGINLTLVIMRENSPLSEGVLLSEDNGFSKRDSLSTSSSADITPTEALIFSRVLSLKI